MPDGKKRITDYPLATTVNTNDYVMIDNGGANGTKKYPASNLGGYTETELFSDAEGVSIGNMSLDGDIFDYDAFIFEINDPQNEPSHIILPATAFTQGTACNIGGVSQQGPFFFQLEMQDSGTIAINNSTQYFKIYTITGIKY